MRNYRTPIWQTLGLGAIAGVRASAAPAIARHMNTGFYPALSFPGMIFLRSPVTTMATQLFRANENEHARANHSSDTLVLSDFADNIASGAFVGAIIFRKSKQSILQGMVIGAAAALATSVATFYLRKHADKLPDATKHLTSAFGDAFTYSSGVSL
ncbi:hypothetical protein IDJ75_17890 [Mucilaginibacter rigui]|uniref:DUF4126 family protein n=1 Tax=Mucilaginibacter rigui TaxID=534635 RepID=A0ABR7X9C8_9SPHI|nr:hypothetical protein [Mucilaginibacter rigui]MBD1387164.1 hypothetical protein [Mucilaginibacter rigui]